MILEVEGLVKNFGGLTAVDHVSLRVQEREILGLIGPNGAGKTTFLNCITGAHKPSAGYIAFQGKGNLAGSPPETMCRQGISRTFQISRPFPRLTVLENATIGAAFGAVRQSSMSPEQRAVRALEMVRFPLAVNTPAGHLNTVQLKRLDLARALAGGPKLLMLDELAAGLSTGELAEIMDLIHGIRDMGVTIIIVEHIMKVIRGVCDRIVVLDYGKKIAEGTSDQVMSNPEVIRAYLGEQ
jgi:branched-chain amino acid transport system ATP-binding protein